MAGDPCGEASLPASSYAGSPGMENMMRNVMTLTPTSTKTSCKSRRMMYETHELTVLVPLRLHGTAP